MTGCQERPVSSDTCLQRRSGLDNSTQRMHPVMRTSAMLLRGRAMSGQILTTAQSAKMPQHGRSDVCRHSRRCYTWMESDD